MSYIKKTKNGMHCVFDSFVPYWIGTTFCVSGSVGDSESLHDVG